MMDEFKELYRELKNPAVAIGLGAMIALIVLLYNIQFKIKPPVKTVQVDYCWIAYRAQAVDQFGLPHIIWTKGFGRCSDLDRYENT